MMKKLFLFIGLVVFISITAESLESIFNTDLSKCKTIKNKKLTTDQKQLKKLGRDIILLDKIETTTACYGEIIVSNDCTYKGEFQNRIKHGYGELSCSVGSNTQLWEEGKLIKNYSIIEVQELKIKLGIIKTVKEEFYCESKKNGNVYIGPLGCFNNITLTKEEFLSKSDKLITYNPNTIFYCEKKGGWEIYITSTSCDSSSLSITKEEFTKKTNTNYTKGMESFNNAPRKHFCDLFPKATPCKKSVGQGQIQEKKTASFDELALSLGCGIKRKDVEDCVRRYLPSFAGQGPMTMGQINELKKDKLVMGEIVSGIKEMARAQNQSSAQPQEQNQAQATQGNQQYYGYNPIAEKIWNKMGWTTLRRNPSSMSTFSHTYIGK